MTKETKIRQRMNRRVRDWYENPNPTPELCEFRSLLNKAESRPYLARHGIATPEIMYKGCAIDGIDFDNLPARCAIKPTRGWDADGVMLFADGRELMRQQPVAPHERADFVRQTIGEAKHCQDSHLMVESLVEDYDPRYPIPRDFKVFVASGRVWLIQVIDRNGPEPTHAFYWPNWTTVSDPVKTHVQRGADIPRPPALTELLTAAEKIARDIGVFMRLDFYLTPEGVVFGEFTPTPAMGWNFTKKAGRFLCQLMKHSPANFPKGWTAHNGRPNGFRAWLSDMKNLRGTISCRIHTARTVL